MARKYIGPVVDFRLPLEVSEWVKGEAKARGVPDDEMFRHVLIVGMNIMRAQSLPSTHSTHSTHSTQLQTCAVTV